MIKKARLQLSLLIIAFICLFSGTIVCVWANVTGNRKIEISGGSVDITLADKTLYVKDVRVKESTDSNNGTTIDSFQPGFVNAPFNIDLGSYTTTSRTFTIYLDVVNCSETTFQPKVTSQPTNATVAVSGSIADDKVSPTNVSTAPISGTITLEVVASSSPATIDLSQIIIEIEEFNFEALSNNTSLGTASYTGTVNIGNEVTLSANFFGPNAEFLGWAKDSADGEIVADTMEYTFTYDETSADKYYAIYQTLNASGISYTLTSSNSTASAKKTSNSSPSGSVRIPSAIYSGSQKYNVTSIGSSAFQFCGRLTSITIPNSVTSIGDYAFSSCSGLTSITIGNSVTSIGFYAFSHCSGLTSITVDEGNSKYHSNGNCIIETDSKTLIAGCKKSVIPDDGSVTSIGSQAFRNCSGLTSITIPDLVTSIGSQAFYYCSGLTSITIGNSVTSIGNSAFSGCKGLTSITIPNSVTSISSNAFQSCSGLTSVTIGNSVTTIGNSAFYLCGSLTDITIGSKVNTIGTSAFENCKQLTNITINSADIYNQILSDDSCEGLVLNAASIKVLKSIVDDSNNQNPYLNNEYNYTKSLSIDGNYYEYSKNSIDFNGTSDYFALGRKYMFEDKFTVSLEAYMNNWADYASKNMRLISCTESGGWNFEQNSGYITSAVYDKGVGYKHAIADVSWSSLSSGWHSFKAVFDGTNFKIYLDGQLIATSPDLTSGKLGYHSTNGIFIGAEPGSSAEKPVEGYFKGQIKNLIIVNEC